MTQAMTQDALTLVPCRPIEPHARLVMAWRNDPLTLRMSYHRAPKVWQHFWPEYCRDYFRHAALPPLFLCRNAVPQVFLRYQPLDDRLERPLETVEISINVAPAARGQGLGKAALAMGADFAVQAGAKRVLAEVRVENDVSRRLFLSAGFDRLEEADKIVADTGERCRIVRFVWAAP